MRACCPVGGACLLNWERKALVVLDRLLPQHNQQLHLFMFETLKLLMLGGRLDYVCISS